jgi:putative ABC transport system ATP-binding protein
VTPVLEFRDVSKSFGEGSSRIEALRAIDLFVASGEMVAVMGRSGSGKSTLLTIAGTLEKASVGEVLINGVDVGGLNRDELAATRRREVGFVFQDFNLLAGLSAIENVSMPLELDGVPTSRARSVAQAALDSLGLAERTDDFPDDLSGGERQRIAIARAIVGNRRLVLADEPTGALDSVTGEAVMRLLRDASRTGAAVIVVTHDAQLAAWADRVVFLRDGRLIDQAGPPAGPEVLLVADPSRS